MHHDANSVNIWKYVYSRCKKNYCDWDLFRILWQMQPLLSACMYAFSCMLNHIHIVQGHMHGTAGGVAWGELPPHACAACSAVTEPQKPASSSIPHFLSRYFFFTPAAPLSLLYSCLPSVLPFSCLSFLLLALYIHDQLCVSCSCSPAVSQSSPALSCASLAWT